MSNKETPKQVSKLLFFKSTREPKPKPYHCEDTMAKPNGITKTRGKYKVVLDTHGKKVHIGYYKTLEHAEEALEQARKDAGDD